MFPKKLNGRRLGALVSLFLGKCYARADLQLRERIVQHAVAVEIDLLSITGLEETELAERLNGIGNLKSMATSSFFVLDTLVVYLQS